MSSLFKECAIQVVDERNKVLGEMVISYQHNEFSETTYLKISALVLSIFKTIFDKQYILLFQKETSFQLLREKISLYSPVSGKTGYKWSAQAHNITRLFSCLFKFLGEDNDSRPDPFFEVKFSPL